MNKNTIILIGITASLLTMGAGCTTRSNGDQTGYDYDLSPPPSPSIDVAYGATERKVKPITITILPSNETAKINSVSKTIPTKNYTTALGIHQNSGYYFQFSDCSRSPETLNIRNGEKFMIDNRDNKAHEINIELKNYKLQAYNFAIITIEDSGTYNISCDDNNTVLLNIDT